MCLTLGIQSWHGARGLRAARREAEGDRERLDEAAEIEHYCAVISSDDENAMAHGLTTASQVKLSLRPACISVQELEKSFRNLVAEGCFCFFLVCMFFSLRPSYNLVTL